MMMHVERRQLGQRQKAILTVLPNRTADLQTLKAAAENLLPTSTSSHDRAKQMYIKGIKFGCLHAAIPARDLTPKTLLHPRHVLQT